LHKDEPVGGTHFHINKFARILFETEAAKDNSEIGCSTLGIPVVPRETEDNAYAKFWGANKVYYGGCGNGE